MKFNKNFLYLIFLININLNSSQNELNEFKLVKSIYFYSNKNTRYNRDLRIDENLINYFDYYQKVFKFFDDNQNKFFYNNEKETNKFYSKINKKIIKLGRFFEELLKQYDNEENKKKDFLKYKDKDNDFIIQNNLEYIKNFLIFLDLKED